MKLVTAFATYAGILSLGGFHMFRAGLILGGITFICVLWTNLGAYFDGLAFEKSWLYPMVLPLLALLSSLGFIIALLIIFVLMIRGKTNFQRLLLLLMIPILVYAVHMLPFPGFGDGMRDAVRNKLERIKLIEFSEQAKLIADVKNQKIQDVWITEPSPLYPESSTNKFDTLKDIYPQALELSRWPVRIRVYRDKVVIIYGGALSKHFGYAIVDDDKCPIDRHTPDECERVYENVWVYSDIY